MVWKVLALNGSGRISNASYLNRTHCVAIIRYYSNTLSVECGVPQGSIIGPLLLLIYVNNYPRSCDDIVPFSYAGVTNCVYIRQKNATSTLQDKIEHTPSWLVMFLLIYAFIIYCCNWHLFYFRCRCPFDICFDICRLVNSSFYRKAFWSARKTAFCVHTRIHFKVNMLNVIAASSLFNSIE